MQQELPRVTVFGAAEADHDALANVQRQMKSAEAAAKTAANKIPPIAVEDEVDREDEEEPFKVKGKVAEQPAATRKTAAIDTPAPVVQNRDRCEDI